jgi:hypothetical protein
MSKNVHNFFMGLFLICINGREKVGLCRGEGGEILSGDKPMEAQGWDILRMD